MTQDERFDLLVVAAHAPDLQGLRRHTDQELEGEIRGLRVLGKAVGVGLAAAGAGTMRRILQTRPRAVILIGTCGVYPGQADWQPHDVAVAEAVRLLDHTVLGGRSVFPDPASLELQPHSLLSAGLAAVRPRTRRVGVASPLGLTVDDTLAGSVPQSLGCQVESLEAFAVGHACRLGNVPFAAVLGVTHVVGSRGLDDWRRFARDSTTAAAEVLATWAHNGAQGLPHG